MRWSRHRLHTPAEFRTVTRRGTRSARSHVVVYLALLDGGAGWPRVGFVVSKKIGHAVVRNRVTRRLREIIRPRLPELPAEGAVVIRALPGVDEISFAQLRDQVLGALESAMAKQRRRGGWPLPEEPTVPPSRRDHVHPQPADPTARRR